MRLVDGEKRQPDVPHELGEPFEGETLGGDVHDLERPRPHRMKAAPSLVGVERRREERRRDATRAESPDLIFHERDERRDDHRRAVENDRRKLVTKRFAAARGSDQKHLTRPLEQGVDRFALPGVKRGETEPFDEHAVRVE